MKSSDLWTVIAVHQGVDGVEVRCVIFDAPLRAMAYAIARNYEVVPPGTTRRVGGRGLYRLAEGLGISADELDAAVAAELAKWK